jgi:hypothetical protein
MAQAPFLFAGQRLSKGPSRAFVGIVFLSTSFVILPLLARAARMQVQSSPSTTWAVTIVLPSRIVAGAPATLAVLGVDGRLASDVTVEVGNDRVTTDGTGRAFFTAPSSGNILFAKASGASAAALIDPAAAINASTQRSVSVTPVVSLREPFSICGAGFRGDADGTHVRINGEPALVMAASPECLSVLPNPESKPGAAQISIVSAVSPGGQWSANTTLVSLDSEFPESGLTPGQKSLLTVRVRGSEQRLRIAVENQTPGVLRFTRGDAQELVTTGGPQNVATVEAQAIRSGDFSFAARLIAAPDEALARQYLEAAVPLATKNLQRDINRLMKQLARHPRDVEEVRRGLDGILTDTMAGDFRTLLAAARMAL